MWTLKRVIAAKENVMNNTTDVHENQQLMRNWLDVWKQNHIACVGAETDTTEKHRRVKKTWIE